MGERRAGGVSGREHGEEGFLLLGALVMIFLVLLALSVAAPRIARGLQREREVESAHRANQYVRAIRMYYKKFGHYPNSIEQLEKTNNQRFLRQRYADPLTGKADWRLIHLGENQTKVKGFFGEELQGLQSGLGSAAGMASGFGASTVAPSSSAFGNGGSGAAAGAPGAAGTGVAGGGLAGGGLAGGGLGGTAIGGGTGQSAGVAAGPGTGFGAGTAPAAGTGAGATPAGADALTAGGTGGVIMGIGSSRTGESIVDVNEQSTYETWEFLYDPRIEQLYAKGNLLGGGSAGLSSGSGLGSLSGSQSGGVGAATPTGAGNGTGPGTPATGTGAGNGSRTPPL